ncbi:hypothetical protein [Rubellicoccus peritrichatus]|uniref:Uncharacterized protein n=1 Tax=Rubellicoccus peritrichatus TaxID=3080537 RepID=A0AAQ3QXK7_9BACT|nr:hypothetical protein [Puniceicoccus sp. CR14]WOO43142.1 hypothetical protein RZN69_08555 [Puniceicoccus sp. CR14]
MAYFSNGSEGAYLDNQCAECPIGKHHDAPCPVLLQTQLYNYAQCGNENLEAALNVTVNKHGDCQMKKVLEEFLPDTEEEEGES